mgnify:CR=1 FL=1
MEQILPKGMIVYTEDKSGHRTEHTCKGKTPIDIPLVVLVNETVPVLQRSFPER